MSTSTSPNPPAAPSASSAAVTFKLCFGDEIRRFTVAPGVTTYSSTEAVVREWTSLTVFRLTWKDEEGDNITIRSQADLEECTAFMARRGLDSLKVNIEKASPPGYSATSDAEADLGELGDTQKLLSGEDLIDPSVRRKLEHIDAKMGKMHENCLAEVQKLQESPHFDEKEYTRQIQVMEEAGVAVYPFIRLALAKRITKINKAKTSTWGNWGWGRGCDSWVSDMTPCLERRLANMTEKTRVQIQKLRDSQMPCGWVVVGYLEMQNKLAAETKASEDPLLKRQLAQVSDLKNIPEPIVVRILSDYNKHGSRRHCGGGRGNWGHGCREDHHQWRGRGGHCHWRRHGCGRDSC